VVGVAKPDPEIFHLALKRLGTQASDAVMLGDVPKFDVDGARAAGVRAVLIDPLNLHAHLDVPRTPDLGTFVEALLGPD
jgi:FMN phosphatase YigB (HAD superfamily)